MTVAGQPGGWASPAPDATVGVYDDVFGMPATLPRQGTLRFENRGERLHFAVVFPDRRGAGRAAAVKALMTNDERRLGRLASGAVSGAGAPLIAPATAAVVTASASASASSLRVLRQRGVATNTGI